MPGSVTAVKTRMQPLNVNTTKGGEIVRYVPPPASSSPQVINPVPVGTYSKPAALPATKKAEPDILDAEIIPATKAKPTTPPQRRPVVGSDARPSSQSSNPAAYPKYPDPSARWRTLADFAAWQNGESREIIDREAEAYEFTRDWGKTGGVLYPWTANGPRTPIVSENYDLANRYRARNGLPAIDRFGYEQPAPLNPSVQPGVGFSSNPFKTALDNVPEYPSTPANFPDRRQSPDIDPDTGKPYTPLQQQRGRDLGRPAWHINPETGNPWGSDEQGTPLPLPFDGAPGGGVSYPLPDTQVSVRTWEVTLTLTHPNELARGRGTYKYYVDSPSAPSVVVRDGGPQTTATEVSNGAARILEFVIGGSQVSGNGSGDTDENGQWVPFGVTFGPAVPYAYTGTPQPGSDPTFSPIGKPSQPLPPSDPQGRVSPTASPAPQPDTRSNPSPASPQPINPSGKPSDSPYAPAPVRSPVPSPRGNPNPSIPSLPTYSPNPSPYPRTGPNGSPAPSPDPQARPEPARPKNPAPTETIDRPSKPPVNPSPNSGKCNPCPDPCPPEETQVITYKKFKGCLVLPSGVPDRFEVKTLTVPKNAARAIESMLNSLADIQSQECAPCCYWDISKGNPQVLWAGIPSLIGQEFSIDKGIARINITFNAIDAINDNTLRNLKRIATDGDPAHTFVNTAVIYLVNDKGYTIATEQVWNVGTEIMVPFEYRERNMKLRLLPKGAGVNFTISDSGDRWIQRTEE